MEQLPLKVFIGSSSEKKVVAEALASHLDACCDVLRWWECFPPGKTTLDTLVETATASHLAVFIVGSDDIVRSRNIVTGQPRDNVLYELGLFSGNLGTNKSLMIVDEAENVKVPTDLNGVAQIRWNSKDPETLQHVTLQICKRIEEVFCEEKLGWWAIRLDNDVHDGRSFYGVFQVVIKGKRRSVRYGNSRYAESMVFEANLHNKMRSSWRAKEVLFISSEEGDSIFFKADVTSSAPPSEPLVDVKQAIRYSTIIEAEESGEDGLYRGRYFDVDRLTFFGRIQLKRLGNMTQKEAESKAKGLFAFG